ncbi:TPA: hypothetical protein ACN305_003269 [Vibrio campbellii]|nr:hypothetical protein [Vibrio campbellii]MCE7731556.1 hypothetical protein [Vibrio campbellii]HDM8216513.1 hypothetical protein [Vibrio campbellii]
MNQVQSFFTNKYTQAGVAMTLSVPAFADGSGNANIEAINGAVASGGQMVSLTTSGVIGIAAMGFGLGMVVAWLRR